MISLLRIALIPALFTFLLSFPSLANQSNPEDHYTILKTLFDTAQGRPEITEFPYLTGYPVGPGGTVCATLWQTPGQIFYVGLGWEVRDTPGAGPLIPDKRERKLVFDRAGEGFNQASVETAESEIILKNPVYLRTIDSSEGTVIDIASIVTVRKNGLYYPFRVRIEYPEEYSEYTFETYGYCFPVGTPLI